MPKLFREKEGALFSNRDLLRLMWPLLVEQTLSVLVGMADTVMISSAGEAAISGVSLVDMLNNLIFHVFAALATGGAVVVSQALGAKEENKASRSAGQLVTLSAMLGLLVMTACLALSPLVLRLLFGTIEPEVMRAALLYFRITAISYPFLALYNAGAAIFRSVGNSAVSMRVSMLMNVINVVGNAICIYGFHLGVVGVAVPTLVSRVVAAVLILRKAARPDNAARVTWDGVRQLELRTAHRILAIGIPSGIENSFFQLGRVLVVSMISLHGTVHISANAVANNLDGINCIAGNALGLAMITVVGRCIGAKDLKQASHYAKKILLIDYLVQGSVMATMFVFVPVFLKAYTLSAATTALSIKLVRIHAGFGMWLWPIGFVLPNALRAADDVKFTMFISTFSMVAFRLSFAYLLCVQMGMGAVGVWYAMVTDWVFRAVCFVIRFACGKWKRKFEEVPA